MRFKWVLPALAVTSVIAFYFFHPNAEQSAGFSSSASVTTLTMAVDIPALPVISKTVSLDPGKNCRLTLHIPSSPDTISTVADETYLPSSSLLRKRDYFEEINIPVQEFMINPQKDERIITGEGTRIFIPAGTIVNQTGQAITEPVKITYRQYDDPPEIVFSNLTMQLDATGENFMQSAGMFEIYAYNSRNESLEIAEDGQIGFGLPAIDPENSYNIYQLDTADQWTETTSNVPVVNGNSMDSIWQYEYSYQKKDFVFDDSSQHSAGTVFWREKIKDPETGKMVRKTFMKIVSHDNYNRRYNLLPAKIILPDIDFKAYADIRRTFRKTDWSEVDEYERDIYKFSKKLKEDKEIIWENIEVEFHGDDTYDFIMTKGDTSITLSGQGSGIMNSVHEMLYEKRAEKDEKRRLKHIGRMEKNKSRNNFDRVISDSTRVASRDFFDGAQNYTYVEDTELYRFFRIKGFGIWNCDKPEKLPSGASLAFVNGDFGSDIPYLIKLVDLKKNAVFTYYPSRFNDFQYNPQATNLAYYAFAEDSVKVFLPESFEAEDRSQLKNYGWKTCSFREFKTLVKEYADRKKRKDLPS